MNSFWQVEYECTDGSGGMMVYKITNKRLSKGKALTMVQKAKPDACKITKILKIEIIRRIENN